MNQREAVIKVMTENGGYATLAYLYQHVFDIPKVSWNSKTPYASIRRIVQDSKYFFKIKPGLWALKSEKNKIEEKFNLSKVDEAHKEDKQNLETFTHSFYQGLIVEIGNIKGYDTYVPQQDKNKYFLEKKLKSITKINELPRFTYENVLRYFSTIDILWINQRGFPTNAFEIEHTTNFNNSLLKFTECQDFNISFTIVSSKNRKKEFQDKIKRDAFKSIYDRVKFFDYEIVAKFHENAHKLDEIEKKFKLN